MSKLNNKPFYFARITLFIYSFLLAYLSLTPFNFDLSYPLQPWDWCFAPTPRYIPIFDVVTNILAYTPLGFLLVFAVYPQLRKGQALLISMVLGLLFSAVLESMQSYLSTRIPSMIDWYSNGLGMLLGALFAIPLSPEWLSGNILERVRESYFGKYQGFFILLLLCLIAQIYPQNAWLGMGDFGYNVTKISPYWSIPLDNASQEVLITALAVIGIGNFALFGMKRSSKPLKVIAVFFLVMIIFKGVISELQFGQTKNMQWLSASMSMGALIGCGSVYLASKLNKKMQWYLASVTLIGLCLIVNLLPNNPYFLSQLEQLPQGNLIHLNGLLGWISLVWPYLAILLLLRSKHIELN